MINGNPKFLIVKNPFIKKLKSLIESKNLTLVKGKKKIALFSNLFLFVHVGGPRKRGRDLDDFWLHELVAFPGKQWLPVCRRESEGKIMRQIK